MHEIILSFLENEMFSLMVDNSRNLNQEWISMSDLADDYCRKIKRYILMLN